MLAGAQLVGLENRNNDINFYSTYSSFCIFSISGEIAITPGKNVTLAILLMKWLITNSRLSKIAITQNRFCHV